MAVRISNFPSFTKGKAASVSPETGIVIHYYSKGGLPGEKEKLVIKNYGSTFIAEQLCLDIARSLNIAPLTFHLFSLAKLDLSVWLAPNTKIECSEASGVEYVFRMRLVPLQKIDKLVAIDQEAFTYFYLQCRNDFVNECFTYKDSVKQERQLGQGLIDMLCYGREANLSLDQLDKLKPKWFIPTNTKHMFKRLWEKQRLETNMKTQLNAEYEKSERDSLNDIKLRYINGFLEIADKYLVDHFEISADDGTTHTVLIDIYRDDQPGIYIVHNSKGKVDIQDKVDYVCAIEDLYGLNVFVDSLTVHVMSETPTPRLKFQNRAVLESFVSLLSTCYRLMKNFHEPLCDNYNSPMMDELKRVKCHGPVQKDWAVTRLQKKHKENKDCNYLLKQKSSDIGSFVLVYLAQDTHMIVNISRQQSGQLQLSCSTDEPLFPDIASLLRHYTGGGHPKVQLLMCVPPQPPDDPYLLLCRHASMASSSTKEQQRQPSDIVKLVSYVDTCHGVQSIGHGCFTTVWKKKLDEVPKVGEVAIKQLRHSDNGVLLKHFQSAIQSAALWSHANIVKVHAICLAPHFQAMLEHIPLGSLETYLRQPHQGLIVRDLVNVAEDIAQALFYLEAKDSASGCGKAHGNIRCRNVLVWSHQPGSRLVVKLADPGLLHYYNSLPLHGDVNSERFPWIAPECYADLRDVTLYSDRYAFGTTMWELFSSGDRPHTHKTSKQMEDFVLAKKQLPAPELCPIDIYDLMCGCWSHQTEERPTARVILCRIVRVSQSVDGERYYSDLTWGTAETKPTSNYDKLLNQPVVPPAVSKSSAPGLPLPVSPLSSAGEWSGSCDSRTPLLSTACRVADLAPHGLQRPLPDIPPDSHQVIQPDQLDQYKNKPLGKGHYGVVYMGDLHVSGDRCSVAIKSLHAKMYKRYVQEFEKEIKMMEKLSHRNIVKVKGYMPQRDAENPMLLVMEFVDNGCLSHYLRTHKKEMPQNNLLTFGEEIAEGMKYLHSQDIIHRDLAARNILVTSDVHMKISDFGLARILSPERDYYRSDATKEIPAAWCAPEALCQRLFSRESDVWSYGITLWEVYSFGATPSLSCKFGDVVTQLHEGHRLERPESCPQDVYQLMFKCWEYYPEKRILFDNILNAIVGLKSNLPI